jgi:hypothetical protein
VKVPKAIPVVVPAAVAPTDGIVAVEMPRKPGSITRRADRQVRIRLTNQTKDRSQLDYYSEITRNMVGRVLTNRQVVKRDGANYEL